VRVRASRFDVKDDTLIAGQWRRAGVRDLANNMDGFAALGISWYG